MNCKFCQAELESNSSVCPACGKDNLKDNTKTLKIVALSLVCVVMVVLLGGMISYGTTGSFIPDWLVVTEEEKFEASMDKVVATMGEYELTNRQLQLYYWLAAYNETGDADLSKDLSEQIYDETTGQSYEEYFTDRAIEAWQEVMLLSDAAKTAGYEMPADVTESLSGMKEQLEYYVYMYSYYYGLDIETVDDLLELQFGPGCTYEVYYEYTYNYYLGGLYWTEKVESLEVTDEQIEEYFKNNEEALKNDYDISITKDFGNLIDIRMIEIAVESKEVEDDEGNKTKVEDWEACLAKAQQILDAWLAGEKTAESFGALADENGAEDEGGLYTDLYPGCLNSVDVQHILFFPEGATSSDVTSKEWPEEAWAAALAKAENILAQWEAGEKTAESFGLLANENSQDQNGSVTNGGLYEDIYMGQMVAAFEDWCFDVSRQSGDTGIVKTEYGYHVMYFVRADDAMEQWCFDDSRVAEDYAIIKYDGGYRILYFQGAEPAWQRYCRYGAMGELGQQMLEQLREENPCTVHENKIVIGTLATDEEQQ